MPLLPRGAEELLLPFPSCKAKLDWGPGLFEREAPPWAFPAPWHQGHKGEVSPGSCSLAVMQLRVATQTGGKLGSGQRPLPPRPSLRQCRTWTMSNGSFFCVWQAFAAASGIPAAQSAVGASLPVRRAWFRSWDAGESCASLTGAISWRWSSRE